MCPQAGCELLQRQHQGLFKDGGVERTIVYVHIDTTCHTSFQALWEFFSSIPFRTASHLPSSQTLQSSRVNHWKAPKLTWYLLETDHSPFKQLKSGTLFLLLFTILHLSPLSRKVVSKNASVSVCKALFLHSLITEWMCACRGGGVNTVNMITAVLCSINLYKLVCGKCFELSHVMGIVLEKCYALLLPSTELNCCMTPALVCLVAAGVLARGRRAGQHSWRRSGLPHPLWQLLWPSQHQNHGQDWVEHASAATCSSYFGGEAAVWMPVILRL